MHLTLLLAASCVPLVASIHTHQEYFSPIAGPGHKGQCFDQKVNKYGKVGDSWTTTGCKLATCITAVNYKGDTELAIGEDGCERIQRKPGCRQTAPNRNKPYPDCCPKLQCRKTTGGKVITIQRGYRRG